ncbi:MAG: hypothetical protein CK538_04800 [Opitutia bacterium]|nr:esterase-like activity of phytase family protein [Opitutaceae bacterium]PHX85996.1 MAG: hypothetical protein CK538_04800 [Opitutae bacterium]
MSPTRLLPALLLCTGALVAQPVTTVTVNNQTFVNQGLVGVGRMPADLRDKFGETFGSFSAFTFQPGSWQRNANGSYSGTLFAQPDRGYNVAGTTNYVPRFNKITVAFTPAPSGSTAQNQVALTLDDTIKFTESDGTPMTSLDPTSAGTGTRAGLPTMPQAFNGRLSLDAEGIVVNADGSIWVSDEYGPYIFRFTADGRLTSAIRPPEAITPKRGGAYSFASNNPGPGQAAPVPADPTTGRQNNQGLEGLSVSPDGRTLFALLQSAARQDGGTGGTGPRRHTRLLAYDLTVAGNPTLKGEYVVALPTFLLGTATRVPAQSEMLAINNTQFLVLARDGNGRGVANPTSLYRSILVYDISSATDIAGTAYDTPTTPVAPGGVLAAGIVPATSAVLVDLNNNAQLAKFGLNNGPVDNVNTLSEKWEALALVPAFDPGAPNDWFLFVGNDNDFITTNGFQDGAPYAAALDNDNMVLVYRVAIPTRLANVASRALTGPGQSAHVLGFVVSGARPKAMLVRGVGPALTPFGITNALPDPSLTIFNAAGQAVFTNNDWSASVAGAATAAELATAATRAGAFALSANSRDAALLVQLDPGAYTAVVSDASGATGVSLVEVHEVP